MSKARRDRGPGPEAIVRQVREGRIAPFYLLHGEEDYERDATCTWLVEALAPPQARDFNVDVFRADRFEVQDFLQVYSSYPMMAESRLLVLREAEKLSAEQTRSLERVVEDPVETTRLVVAGGKVDMRRRFFQQLARLGTAVEFRPPYDNQVAAWLQRYARKQNLEIEPEAIDLLRLYVGTHLRDLVGELGKLATYVGAGEKITREAVEQAVGVSREVSIFELTDALGSRDGRRAQQLLQRFLDQGEQPTRAVAMIARHLQLLLRARRLVARSTPREKMAGEMGVSPYFLKSYLEQARGFPASALWEGLSALLEADSRLKSQGRRQERLAMDLLVRRLCEGGKG